MERARYQMASTLRTDTDRLPPDQHSSEITRAFDVALDEYRRRFNGKHATYVSVPITTGRRYFDALHARGQLRPPFLLPYEVVEGDVLQPNIRDAREFIASIRLGEEIIDPTAVFVPGASQEEYYEFWHAVLAEIVATLVAGPAWNFSFGCISELAAAFTYHVPACFNGTELDFASAAHYIAEADAELAGRGFATPLLRRFWESSTRSLACSTSTNA